MIKLAIILSCSVFCTINAQSGTAAGDSTTCPQATWQAQASTYQQLSYPYTNACPRSVRQAAAYFSTSGVNLVSMCQTVSALDQAMGGSHVVQACLDSNYTAGVKAASAAAGQIAVPDNAPPAWQYRVLEYICANYAVLTASIDSQPAGGQSRGQCLANFVANSATDQALITCVANLKVNHIPCTSVAGNFGGFSCQYLKVSTECGNPILSQECDAETGTFAANLQSNVTGHYQSMLNCASMDFTGVKYNFRAHREVGPCFP